MIDNEFGQRAAQTATLDHNWLQAKSKADLVDLLVEVSLELRKRLEDETGSHQVPLPEVPTFPDVDLGTVSHFLRLPESGGETVVWRVALVSTDPDLEPLGLDICGDMTIGRNTVDSTVDLDLTPFRAETLGVSRQHAILRPGDSCLMLFDLGSVNGTYCNGSRARLGHHLDVCDGDVITLGTAHFQVLVVDQP